MVINRLYHRELLARMTEIDELEKKWNCKIEFPSTELASDVVTISGPEYQVPQAVDALLVCLSLLHLLVETWTDAMFAFFREWFRKAMSSSSTAPTNYVTFSSRPTSVTMFAPS